MKSKIFININKPTSHGFDISTKLRLVKYQFSLFLLLKLIHLCKEYVNMLRRTRHESDLSLLSSFT